MVSVSTIAVWIRLNELPIEYYEVEVLQQLGNSIGKVLRIDTHTVAETRGRFARLCVQVDINKPLVTTILVGGMNQSVNYEGIHKLCFTCGRIGHRKEACPYAIREPSSPKKVGNAIGASSCNNSHEKCDQVDPTPRDEPTPSEQEDKYGPWLVVSRKRQSNRTARGMYEVGTFGHLRVSGGMACLQVGRGRSIQLAKFIGTKPS